MLRRLFTILSALSLGLCVAAFVLGYRSHRAAMTVEFTFRGERWEVVLAGGELRVDNVPQIWLDRARRRAALLAWQDPRDRLTPDEAEIAERLLSGRASGVWWQLQCDKLFDNLLQKPGGAERIALLKAPPPAYRDYSHPATNLVVILTTLILPTAWLVRTVYLSETRLVRRRKGLCVGCGYDLRGTPGRCPECGAVPS